MLRPIDHSQRSPRLIPFQIDYSGGTPTFTQAVDEAVITDTGTGAPDLALRDPFQRAPHLFATTAVGVGAGSIASVSSATATTLKPRAWTNAAVAADGTIHGLAIGHDSTFTDYMGANFYHHVNSSRIGTRLIGFNVKGTGTAALQSSKRHGTLTDNGTGDYTIALRNPFQLAPVVLGTVIGTTAGVVNVVSTAVNTISVKTYDDAGNLTDQDFYLWVIGFDRENKSGRHRRTANTVHRGARLSLFRIVVTGGVPALTLGTDKLGTVADTGTGDFTLTFTQSFKRAPEVIATSLSNGNIAQVHTAATTTGVRILNFNAAGAAADPTEICVAALGYDDTAEY